MNKKILVTGGAGFIGSHLCEELLKEGNEVTCLDSFYTGYFENISNLVLNPRFKVITQDVTDEIDIEVDEIYNLACPASPIHYQTDPVKTTITSVYGALNMLNLAKKCNAKILQASTSEVYGDPDVHPQYEEYHGNVNPIGIRSCYDEGKRCAESLFFDFHRKYGLEIKVVRIFNTYGPRMDINDGRVVSNLIVQALQGEKITINGDGSQTRSFCFVDDLVKGLIKMMDSHKSITGPINLGNPSEFSILELAKTIISLTNSNSAIAYEPLPEDDPKRRKPNILKAINYLNWEPVIGVEKGLKATIAYFNNVVKVKEYATIRR